MVYLVIRVLYSLLQGIILATAFRTGWNIETKQRGYMDRNRNNTSVWVDPLVFPVLIIILFAFPIPLFWRGYPLSQVPSAGSLIVVFLFISVYFFLLLLFLPMLRKWFTARLCATLWLIPVFLFYQQNLLFSYEVFPCAVTVYIPSGFFLAFFSLWVIGFVLVFLIQILSHLLYVQKLHASSRTVDDIFIIKLWESCRKEIGLTLPIDLRYSTFTKSPLSVGMRRENKITYLPEMFFTEEELRLIFFHELHHIQRNDIHTKFFLKFCTAFGWFHPLIWIAVSKAEEDLELSCDEIVLMDSDSTICEKYAHLILSVAEKSRGISTRLSSSPDTLRYRLQATFSSGKNQKRKGFLLLFSLMFLSSLSISCITLTTDRTTMEKVFLLNDSEIEMAFFNLDSDKKATITETEDLLQYLMELPAETYIYQEPWSDQRKPYLYVRLDSGKNFIVKGNSVKWVEIKDNGIMLHKYYIRTPIDWDYLLSLT